MTKKRRKMTTVYRYLTGPDDASFCHRVTQALSMGWSLYGSPALTFDSATGKVICGQAIAKDVEGVEYEADMKLSEL
ncbi:MAG: DUF1737 domain-containing protein [Methylocystis sp.]|nr:DUF1737 domain-containing protein [Methylocystis sp.]MBI3275433.1 DUF1737 domain-containing protein [Methylocystis sp.]